MRSDIQCLRGIAIISVLLYHLFPSLFSNGFLGVDMFFVLSGYLMCRNLDKNKIKSFKDFIGFYYRRSKRIMPLYYFVIFFVVMACRYVLTHGLFVTNRRYSISSLLFVTNQLTIHDSGDYFREFMTGVSSHNVFLHFWSLGVEMQFYLIVPIIFVIGELVFKTDLLKFSACVFAVIVGLVGFQAVLDKFAFNFMFLRLWQFLSGFCAHYWSKINLYQYSHFLKPGKVEKLVGLGADDIINASLVIISLCFLPSQLDVTILRPLITFTTAFLLSKESTDSYILNSKQLCYIGDISYVLYLVHWPVIILLGGSSTKSVIFCILITFMISILLHHLFEKVYLTFNYTAIILLISGLIIANVCLQYSITNHSIWNHKYSDVVEEVIQNNESLLPYAWVTNPSLDKCTNATLQDSELPFGTLMKYCLLEPGNGNLSVLFIGNSYVLNTADPIRNHFHYNYSSFEYAAIGHGLGLYATTHLGEMAMRVLRRLVENRKPDILFITSRHFEAFKEPFVNPDTDDLINQMNTNIEFYEQFVKQIYILGAHPVYPTNFLNHFVQYYIQNPDDMDNLNIPKKQADKEMKYARKRFSHIKCTKCQVFDISEPFVDGDKYLTFDRESILSYVDNTVHLTTPALQLVDHIFANLTLSIFNRS